MPRISDPSSLEKIYMEGHHLRCNGVFGVARLDVGNVVCTSRCCSGARAVQGYDNEVSIADWCQHAGKRRTSWEFDVEVRLVTGEWITLQALDIAPDQKGSLLVTRHHAFMRQGEGESFVSCGAKFALTVPNLPSPMLFNCFCEECHGLPPYKSKMALQRHASGGRNGPSVRVYPHVFPGVSGKWNKFVASFPAGEPNVNRAAFLDFVGTGQRVDFTVLMRHLESVTPPPPRQPAQAPAQPHNHRRRAQAAMLPHHQHQGQPDQDAQQLVVPLPPPYTQRHEYGEGVLPPLSSSPADVDALAEEYGDALLRSPLADANALAEEYGDALLCSPQLLPQLLPPYAQEHEHGEDVLPPLSSSPADEDALAEEYGDALLRSPQLLPQLLPPYAQEHEHGENVLPPLSSSPAEEYGDALLRSPQLLPPQDAQQPVLPPLQRQHGDQQLHAQGPMEHAHLCVPSGHQLAQHIIVPPAPAPANEKTQTARDTMALLLSRSREEIVQFILALSPHLVSRLRDFYVLAFPDGGLHSINQSPVEARDPGKRAADQDAADSASKRICL